MVHVHAPPRSLRGLIPLPLPLPTPPHDTSPLEWLQEQWLQERTASGGFPRRARSLPEAGPPAHPEAGPSAPDLACPSADRGDPALIHTPLASQINNPILATGSPLPSEPRAKKNTPTFRTLSNKCRTQESWHSACVRREALRRAPGLSRWPMAPVPSQWLQRVPSPQRA